MEHLKISPEVKKFQDDLDKAGLIRSDTYPLLSTEWVNIFKRHYETLLPHAKAGDAWSAYSISSMYLLSLLSVEAPQTEEEYIHEVLEMNGWLEIAAKQGHYGAIDNLMCSQHGDEPKRLWEIYNNNKELFTDEPAPLEGWKKDMEMMYKLAYKSANK